MMSQSSAGSSVITLRFSLDLEPRHRRAGSAGGDQRRGQSAARRSSRAADLRQGQSGRRADPDARRDLEDAQADRRGGHRRKPARAEALAAPRRRPGVDFRRSAAGHAHTRQSAGAGRLRRSISTICERRSPISTSTRRRAISTARRNPSRSTPTTKSAIPTTISSRSIAYRNGAPVRSERRRDGRARGGEQPAVRLDEHDARAHRQHPAPTGRQRHSGRRQHQDACCRR